MADQSLVACAECGHGFHFKDIVAFPVGEAWDYVCQSCAVGITIPIEMPKEVPNAD